MNRKITPAIPEAIVQLQRQLDQVSQYSAAADEAAGVTVDGRSGTPLSVKPAPPKKSYLDSLTAMGEPECKERSRLLDSYFEAMENLASSNRALLNVAGTPGQAEALGQVWGEHEAARRLCRDLRRELYRHVSSHGCGSISPDANEPVH